MPISKSFHKLGIKPGFSDNQLLELELNLELGVPFTRMQTDLVTGFMTSMIGAVPVQSRSQLPRRDVRNHIKLGIRCGVLAARLRDCDLFATCMRNAQYR
jgi:hypothetical protein